MLLAAGSIALAANSTLSVNPASGPAGSSVEVTGSGFPAGPVEIRWGSHHGALLETVAGPAFSAQITIPTTAPAGIHTLVAAPTDEHASDFEQYAAFEVTGGSDPPGGSAPPPGGVEQPPPVQTPSTPNTATAPARTGRRARAIRRCKRKYRSKRGRTRAQRKRVTRKKRACLRSARKLPV